MEHLKGLGIKMKYSENIMCELKKLIFYNIMQGGCW